MGGRYHRLRLRKIYHNRGGMDRRPHIIRGLGHGRHCTRRKLSRGHHIRIRMDRGAMSLGDWIG